MMGRINNSLRPLLQFLKDNAAIAVSLISGYGYACTYLYYTGFADFYGIPVTIIPIQITDVIRFALNLLIFLVLLCTAIVFFPTPNRKKMAFISWVAFSIGIAYFFTILRQLMALPNTIIYVEFSLIAISGLVPFLSGSNTECTTSEPSPFSKKILVLGFVIFALASVFLSNQLGYGNAANKAIYLTSVDKPNFIVIDQHDEKFICINYDLKTKKAGDTISVFKLKDSGPLRFVAKKIGPLRSNSLSDRK